MPLSPKSAIPDALLPARPVMVWDGDCSFCGRWIARWKRLTGGAVEYEPYQRLAGRFATIPAEAFAEAVHLVEPDGSVTRGAAAVFRSLALAGRMRCLERVYRDVPLAARTCDLAYRLVARNRGAFDRIERALTAAPPAPPPTPRR